MYFVVGIVFVIYYAGFTYLLKNNFCCNVIGIYWNVMRYTYVKQHDATDCAAACIAITVCKLNTTELKDIYRIMIASGANYKLKDDFEKSCLDYSKELNWRKDFISIVEEFESENK